MSQNLTPPPYEAETGVLTGDAPPSAVQKQRRAHVMALMAMFGMLPGYQKRRYFYRSPRYRGGPYMPHQGAKECARRRNQMARKTHAD